MNENLFTFPGGTAEESGDNPFDLSGFTELTGNDTQNPFADLLAGGEATEQPPAEGAGAVPSDDPIPEEKDETAQHRETVEEDESHEISKSPDIQDPQPKSPPAPKSEEDHASDTPEEKEHNPLLAAMERQEEKNAQKAAEPIFAQLPVFSYNGSEEPIEDIEQTFDELRLSKLTDFPEFDEAQSLIWKVVYGKIVKEIALPKKTKIGQIKREIETSKEFIERRFTAPLHSPAEEGKGAGSWPAPGPHPVHSAPGWRRWPFAQSEKEYSPHRRIQTGSYQNSPQY